MKSLIFFIALLFFVSCSKKAMTASKPDDVLLQISQNPKSEAIFAMMSMHLQGDGDNNSGFEKILQILTSLIDEINEQLYENQNLLKIVQDITVQSETDLKDRIDFFKTRKNEYDYLSNTSKQNIGFNQMLKSDRENCVVIVNQVKQDRANADSRILEDNSKMDNQLTEGINACSEALNSLDGGAPSLIQTSLSNVNKSLTKLKKNYLLVPENLIQLAQNDDKVKKRLQEWLSDLKIELMSEQNELTQMTSTIGNESQALVVQFDKVLVLVTDESVKLQGLIDRDLTLVSNLETLIGDIVVLIAKCEDALAAYDAYLASETANANTAIESLTSDLQLFKDARDYFRANYQKLKHFIKQKFD